MKKKWIITVQIILLFLAFLTAFLEPEWLQIDRWGRAELEEKTYQKTYFDTGRIQEEGWMYQGKRSGWWTTYHTNGKPLSKGEFKDDSLVGTWTFYDSTGTVKEVKVF